MGRRVQSTAPAKAVSSSGFDLPLAVAELQQLAALDLLDFLLQNPVTSWTSKIVIVLFLGYAVIAILFYLARQEEVTPDMIMAAASEYMLISKKDSAEIMIRASMDFARLSGTRAYEYASSISDIGDIYGQLGKPKEAEAYLLESIAVMDSIKRPINVFSPMSSLCRLWGLRLTCTCR